MNQLAIINPENVTEDVANSYPIRKSARAVVVDEKHMIALLYVAKVKGKNGDPAFTEKELAAGFRQV